jgi:hypothetical protein
MEAAMGENVDREKIKQEVEELLDEKRHQTDEILEVYRAEAHHKGGKKKSPWKALSRAARDVKHVFKAGMR